MCGPGYIPGMPTQTTVPEVPSYDLVRIMLAVLFIGVIIATSIGRLLPFLLALTWATMFVVTTWPLLLGARSRLWTNVQPQSR